jgi:tetratricopeptide (TPR) repeat protein
LFGWSENPEADLARSSALEQKALALDDSNAYALTVLCYDDFLKGRYDRAVAEGERATAINSNYAPAYEALSTALVASDKLEEALGAAEKAMRLDPAAPNYYGYFIAAPLAMMGHYQEAVPLLKRTVAVIPDQAWAHIMLVFAYTELGRGSDAAIEAAEVMRISPQWTLASVPKGKNAALDNRFRSDLRKAGLK